ncbi:Uncharacterised protein (plasmid) [Klebsiella aerogenes]|nr:Uncharacterised protein [Klebsiella aerogenes]
MTIRIHNRVGKDIRLPNSVCIPCCFVGITAVRMDR